MKTILLILAIGFSANAAFSQINKGQWLTGGNGTYTSQKRLLVYYNASIPDVKYSNLQLSADAGYFFVNGLAGGLRVSLSSSKQKSDVSYVSTSWNFAPFARYYILPSSQKINFFADASYLWGTSTNNTTTPTSTSKNHSSSNGYALMAGPAFFLSPSASLELTAGYTSINQAKAFGAGVGFKIHLGKGKK